MVRQQKAAAEDAEDDALLDSTVELVRAYKAINDPERRKQLRDFARYLADGGKIQ